MPLQESVGKSTRAHSNGHQGFIRKYPRIHNKVNSHPGPLFFPGVNGTSSLISDHHTKERVTAPLFPLMGSRQQTRSTRLYGSDSPRSWAEQIPTTGKGASANAAKELARMGGVLSRCRNLVSPFLK